MPLILTNVHFLQCYYGSYLLNKRLNRICFFFLHFVVLVYLKRSVNICIARQELKMHTLSQLKKLEEPQMLGTKLKYVIRTGY